MLDYQRLFHTGVRVADLDKAMAEIGESAGVGGGVGVGWAVPGKSYQLTS